MSRPELFLSNLPPHLTVETDVERLLLREYGSVFVAGTSVTPPPKIVFADQADVIAFQEIVERMPTEIGGWTEGVWPGAFWQGMVDWVDGIRTIDQVLADIDAEWIALRAEGES